MTDFIYLYRGGQRSTPEQMQQTMQKWMGWMEGLRAKGHLKDGGYPLEETGKVVKGNPKAVTTDGPYAETKDIVGGFSIVTAKDLAEASQLSQGCPIFESGGLVEVRPIMKIGA